MDYIFEIILKIVGGILALAGLIIVYAAPNIVKNKKLDEKKVIDPERVANLDEEQLKKFKFDSTVLDVKLKGLIFAIPGFIILLFMFRMK